MDTTTEIRARREKLYALQQEMQRRRDLKIERAPSKDRWQDATTKQTLSDQEVLKREIAHEKQRPPAVDLQNKVIVDREWLIETLGQPAFDEAMDDRFVQSLSSWL